MDPLTVALVCLVLVEPVLVLVVAPRITRKLTEDNAVAIFEERLLPLIRASFHDLLTTNFRTSLESWLLPDLTAAIKAALPTPTPEQQAEAQAELVASLSATILDQLPATVQAAVAEAVKANVSSAASALSARGVSAREDFAAKEEQFKMAVLKHDKGGMLVLAALEGFKAMFPGTYKFGVNAAALDPSGGAVDEFLQKHGDKLRLGFGADKTAATPKTRITLV
jgi:hypothetical protein